MINLKYFKQIFESTEITSNPISIDLYCEKIGISPYMISNISDWWNKNRSHIDIHFFPFSSIDPIAGVFLGEKTVCINQNLRMPPHIKLFLALHESRHCDQYKNGDFIEGYYDTVLKNDFEGFLEAYSMFEKDANDFAIDSMRNIGFSNEMNREENMIRGNERAGRMVYNMMKKDIERIKPTDFFDLLKKQIL